jgi:hypothetical protein
MTLYQPDSTLKFAFSSSVPPLPGFSQRDEDRLDDRLASAVNGSPSIGAQFVLHGLLGRALRRWAHTT